MNKDSKIFLTCTLEATKDPQQQIRIIHLTMLILRIKRLEISLRSTPIHSQCGNTLKVLLIKEYKMELKVCFQTTWLIKANKSSHENSQRCWFQEVKNVTLKLIERYLKKFNATCLFTLNKQSLLDRLHLAGWKSLGIILPKAIVQLEQADLWKLLVPCKEQLKCLKVSLTPRLVSLCQLIKCHVRSVLFLLSNMQLESIKCSKTNRIVQILLTTIYKWVSAQKQLLTVEVLNLVKE